MELELDAPTNDVITMNLTIAALDRWLAQTSGLQSGEAVGREIGAMYREIHAVVDEISPEEDEEDEDEDDEDDEDVIVSRGVTA